MAYQSFNLKPSNQTNPFNLSFPTSGVTSLNSFTDDFGQGIADTSQSPLRGDFGITQGFSQPAGLWDSFSNNLNGSVSKFGGDFSDYFKNTPTFPKFDPTTGKTSNSLLGGFGSLANFGLNLAGFANQNKAAKQATENMKTNLDLKKKEYAFNQLLLDEALTKKRAREIASVGGITAADAAKQARADPNTLAQMAKYGLTTNV